MRLISQHVLGSTISDAGGTQEVRGCRLRHWSTPADSRARQLGRRALADPYCRRCLRHLGPPGSSELFSNDTPPRSLFGSGQGRRYAGLRAPNRCDPPYGRGMSTDACDGWRFPERLEEQVVCPHRPLVADRRQEAWVGCGYAWSVQVSRPRPHLPAPGGQWWSSSMCSTSR